MRSTLKLPVFRLLSAFIAVLAAGLTGSARAQGVGFLDTPKMTLSPHLDSTGLVPGQHARLAVVIKFEKGWHGRSNQSDIQPTKLAPTPNDSIVYGKPKFPPGKDLNLGINGLLNVYEDKVIVIVPVDVKSDAKPGPITLAGNVSAQICDDNTCLPPQDYPFELKTEMLAPGATTQPASPEIFNEAITAIAAPPPPPIVAAPDADTPTLGAAFALAFVVGLVFNVVPCVLPVLPLKAIGFYETAQHNRGKSVMFGLTFSLGIVAAFAVLGLLVVVLKWVAWGELFSNDWFTGTLVIILVAMALNMFGVFNVNLPAGAYAFSPRHDTYFGNFLFGILTAALSTPCTFGLFVSVLTVALTQPAFIGMVLICEVGAGMAAPYLVLSAMPELARKFPRTGPWAELVKQFMAFLLLGVAIFFAQGWIAKFMQARFTYWIIYAVMLAGCAFLIAKAFKYAKTKVAPTVAIAIALAIAVPGLFVTRAFAVEPYEWQPYTPQLLSDLQDKNQIVLVDFTATWCINCHTVEATVLNSREVQRLVQDHHVHMVKADITDKEQPAYRFWKYDVKAVGVPLTMVYPPGKRNPIALPGIYSIDALKAAIEQASAKQTAAK